MKTVACSIAVLLAAAPALAGTAPQSRPAGASDLTRALNGLPPAVTAPPATSPTTAPPSSPTPPLSRRVAPTPGPATPTGAPAATPSRTPVSPSTAPVVAPSARPAVGNATSVTVAPDTSRPSTPGTVGPARERPDTPNPAPLPIPVSPAPAPPTVLNAVAVAALPFTITLPTGFQITTGRPGPDFRVYTVRRAGQPFVMIYTGPASQFPIYGGEVVQAAGRASVVTIDGNQRRAVEHLFQRAVAPAEVHIWVSSLDGADRLIAEQIAQSVDVR